jgi:transcriptional regulator with XRE-family HTH domain
VRPGGLGTLGAWVIQAGIAGRSFARGDEQVKTHPLWDLYRLDPFARRLRLLQRNLAVTSARLAEAVSVPVHQIGHWSSGRSKPTGEHRRRLAAALGVGPRWLASDRDGAVDTCLYRFPGTCPFPDSGDLRPGEPDDAGGYRDGGHELSCVGCGQPYLHDPVRGWLYPVPARGGGASRSARAVSIGGVGGEPAEPWPHALWTSGAQGGGPGGGYGRPRIYQDGPR